MFELISHCHKRNFLTAYVETGGIVKDAAAIAAISRETHYAWLKSDPEYAAAFKLAQKIAADELEDEARRRARGVAGAPSDKLLMFLLTHLKPEVFSKKLELQGQVTLKIAERLAAGRKRLLEDGGVYE